MDDPLSPDPTAFGALPQDLSMVAASLRQAIEDNQHVPAVFAEFCARAYSRPDWAMAASPFIVECFAQRPRDLAMMARVSDLIIELTCGSQVYTMTVVAQWMRQGDNAQLLKLADALLVAHGNIAGPEVVHLMLALANSLAIMRYSRAEQLLAAAEPRCGEDHHDSHLETSEWLKLGAALRLCPPSVRELFNHRLRRPRAKWTWQNTHEKQALEALALQIESAAPALEKMRAILPEGWIEQALEEARHRPQEKPAPQPRPQPPPAPSPPAAPDPDWPWQRWPSAWQFFAGGVAGMVVLLGVIGLSPLELRMATSAPSAPGMAPVSSSGPSPLPVASAAEAIEPKASSAAAEVKASQAPAVNAPPPVAASLPSWTESQLAQLAAEDPALREQSQRIEAGSWEEVRSLLEAPAGESGNEAARRAKLLRWLHLRPPADEQIRMQVPNLLAEIKPDGDTLELWSQVVKQGGAMRAVVEKEARRQLEARKQAWSPSQHEQLDRLGWSTNP